MFKKFAILLALSAAYAAPGTNPKVDSNLQLILQNNGNANIFVSFFGGTKSALESIQQRRFASREEQLNTVHDVLVANADRSQRGVLNILSSRGNVQFTPFWISNQVFVRDADQALVQALAEDHEVEKIEEEVIAHIFEHVEMANATQADVYQWGVEKIQAPEAWKELGNKGNGAVVATIDTGVRGTHELLRDNFLGDYGWFDPVLRMQLPTDTKGHGTHSAGIIAGSEGIGVAPGAKWAACRGCLSNSCDQSDLIACGQFFACPTLADGSNPDCSKAPHLVSNNWEDGRRGRKWFNAVIEGWHAAGIIPVFGIGDAYGDDCSTVSYPGNQDVIGVGATTDRDEIYVYSALGPTTDGRMKPDIVAPGADVVSATTGFDSYVTVRSGTSIACSHVAGTIALLVSRNKSLTYDDAKQFLKENTDQDLQFRGTICDGVGDSQFPNHIFGSGRVNALKSVRAQTLQMKRLS